jgi:hypothetical protein
MPTPDPSPPSPPSEITLAALALLLGQSCLRAISVNSAVLHSHIVEREVPEFLKALAAQELKRPPNPTPAELFAAMRAKKVECIALELDGDQDIFLLWQDGDWRLTTPLWSDILTRLGLRNPPELPTSNAEHSTLNVQSSTLEVPPSPNPEPETRNPECPRRTYSPQGPVEPPVETPSSDSAVQPPPNAS